MPVDARRMGISPSTAPASATQGVPLPEPVEKSLATFTSISTVGGFEVSDGWIRLVECRKNAF
jgi:hypothetical protein